MYDYSINATTMMFLAEKDSNLVKNLSHENFKRVTENQHVLDGMLGVLRHQPNQR